MKTLKQILDHKNTPVIALFVFVLAASAAVGILAYCYNEVTMPHAVWFGGLCSWVTMGVGSIWMSKVQIN